MISSKVICIGEALVDQIINNPGKNCKNYLGGAPANVACALKKLGVDTEFIGRVGDDEYGREFINLFRDLGVNIQFIQIDNNCSTRIIKVCIDNNGDRSFSGFVNSQNLFADEMLDRKIFESNENSLKNIFEESKYLITGTNLLASEKSSEALLFLVQYANQFDVRIVIDANWRDIFWDYSNKASHLHRIEHIKEIQKFLLHADVLKLSHEEAILFFRNDNPVLISQSLGKRPDVIITNGDKPISWFINGIQGITKVIELCKVVDTTGAGDSFLAGLISQLLKQNKRPDKKSLNKYIEFASACGLISCLGEGAIEPQPNFKKVQHYLKDLGL